MKYAALATLAIAAVPALAKQCIDDCQSGINMDSLMWQTNMPMKEAFNAQREADGTARVHMRSSNTKNNSDIKCVAGEADGFPCNRVHLASTVNFEDMGCGAQANANDIWGWTDPDFGNEWAIFGCTTGTSFIDITDEHNPFVAAFMPATNSGSSNWRDMKVVNDHVFVGSEQPGHGIQIYDLKQLRDINQFNSFLDPDLTYTETGSTHNMVSFAEGNMIIAVGADTCLGGLHMIDVVDPQNPEFIGCFEAGMGTPQAPLAGTSYSHDAQCVVYHGPTVEFQGRHLCFGWNEQQLVIADITEPTNPTLISLGTYSGVAYAHQGWLTDDHRHIISNDELDELGLVVGTPVRSKAYVWDVTNILAPVVINTVLNPVDSIDHNLYIVDDLAFLQNYGSGLRIHDISNIENLGDIFEVAYFDVYPERDTAAFEGSWSNYPFFRSGLVIISSIERGLFVVRPDASLGHKGRPEFPLNFDENAPAPVEEEPVEEEPEEPVSEGSPETSELNAASASTASATAGCTSTAAIAGVSVVGTLAVVAAAGGAAYAVKSKRDSKALMERMAENQA